MATSKFIYYTSSDPGGPGPLTGLTGSLISVLDACLVNGYQGKPAAGWEKFNSGFTGASGSCLSAYHNVSGSSCWVVVNDTGTTSGAVGKEASVTGWESLTNLTSSGGVFLNSVGAGFGQFPLPTQALTTGRVIWRKSYTADATPRPWMMFADAYTMYLIVATGDSAAGGYGATYHVNAFGDIYSLRGSADAGRCILIGQTNENRGYWWWYDQYMDLFDMMFYGNNSSAQNINPSVLGSYGHWMARNTGGAPGSINVAKYADTSRCYQQVYTLYNGNYYYLCGYPFYGQIPCPNPADQSLYMNPLLIGETNGCLRGRLRGWYGQQHGGGNFVDGQIFGGTGDYAGKTFQCVRTTGPTGASLFVEISPTVETN